MKTTYVFHEGKMIEKHLAPQRGPSGVMIIPDIQPFKSPITGEIISSRNKMKHHMKEHGVTRSEDYSQAYYDKAAAARAASMACNTQADRQDRIETLKHALERQHG